MAAFSKNHFVSRKAPQEGIALVQQGGALTPDSPDMSRWRRLAEAGHQRLRGWEDTWPLPRPGGAPSHRARLGGQNPVPSAGRRLAALNLQPFAQEEGILRGVATQEERHHALGILGAPWPQNAASVVHGNLPRGGGAAGGWSTPFTEGVGVATSAVTQQRAGEQEVQGRALRAWQVQAGGMPERIL